MTRSKMWLWFSNVAVFFLAIDQWTKYLTVKHLALHESVSVIPRFFSFTYVQNTGVAFGMLQSVPDHIRIPLLALAPVGACIYICWYLATLEDRHWQNLLGLSLIFSGAIGNLIDRVRLRYVIDMFHVHWDDVWHYPVFNIADSCICVGFGLLLIRTWRTSRKKAPEGESSVAP